MAVGVELRYIELMKKTLSFALWPEPPAPIDSYNFYRTPFKQSIVAGVVRLLSRFNLGLVRTTPISAELKEDGHIFPSYAETMIGMKRLDNLQHCVEAVINDGVPGDLIETGVWRGGSCIFMKAILEAYGATDRRVFVADSFQGLPKPDADKHPEDADDVHHTLSGVLSVSKEQVEQNFKKYGLLDGNVVFLKGWFKDTLPGAPIERLALMRLDGDMYESTIDALNNLYHKLSPGGFCLIDDYALKGCKAAVDDFRRDHGIAAPIHQVDWTGAYWRKE